MANIDRWLNGRGRAGSWLSKSHRASTTGNVIADKPVSITITRGATTLSAQTVRIDVLGWSIIERTLVDGLGVNSNQRVLVVGYKNHPTIADTNIQLGDTFPYEGKLFRVLKVEPGFTDRVLAIAEAMS